MFFKRNSSKNWWLTKLEESIYYIIKILLNGYIETTKDLKKNIVEVLENMRGSNIINFSNYVDEIIDSYQINKILSLLSNSDLKKMNDTRYCLSKYNNSIKLFNSEFQKSKKKVFLNFLSFL